MAHRVHLEFGCIEPPSKCVLGIYLSSGSLFQLLSLLITVSSW